MRCAYELCPFPLPTCSLAFQEEEGLGELVISRSLSQRFLRSAWGVQGAVLV